MNWALRSLFVAGILLMLLLGSCSNSGDKTIISFWHFWSEPAQKAALQHLVDTYTKSHPDVDIRLTELAWSDGKAKLQLAFNANNQPDIVHVGMDWFAEFNSAHVFTPIKAPVQYTPQGALWVINARALVQWESSSTQYPWGLCANDNHNVLKRTLPILWSAGAPGFYSQLPISAGMDSTLVAALWFVRGLVIRGAILEQGRALDTRFLRGQIRRMYTGAWILDLATSQDVHDFEVVPTRSILNGDVLAVSKNCKHLAEAQSFVTWLTSYQQSKQFCLSVSDAGIPAGPEVFEDSIFSRSAWQKGFLATIHLSHPLPSSPLLLRIEPVVEQMIERCYQAKSADEVSRYVSAARSEIQKIEADNTYNL